MNDVTVSMSDDLAAQIEIRSKAEGFRSSGEYLLALARADCEVEAVELVLDARSAGPFSPLEADWKDRVRDAASHRAKQDN
jgi:hypothetical protein